jgi:hypothetical protein
VQWFWRVFIARENFSSSAVVTRIRKMESNRSPPGKWRENPDPSECARYIPARSEAAAMEIFRNIPRKYVAAACLALSFLLFAAGGTALSQSPFYGACFMIIAILLFFIGAYYGKQEPESE